MSGLLGFDLELLFWTQQESDHFRGFLGCGAGRSSGPFDAQEGASMGGGGGFSSVTTYFTFAFPLMK